MTDMVEKDEPMSPVTTKRPRHSPQGSNQDWEYLLQSNHHTALSSLTREMGLHPTTPTPHITPLPTSDINTSAPLFSHIPSIMFALHLVYEDLKLSSSLSEEVESLCPLLFQLASDLRQTSFTDHYSRDLPHMFNASHQPTQISQDSLGKMQYTAHLVKEAPSIHGWLYHSLQGKECPPLPYIPNVTTRIKNVICLYALLLNSDLTPDHAVEKCLTRIVQSGLRAPSIDVSLSKSFTVGANVSTTQRVVLYMAQLGVTKEDLATMPVGVAIPLMEAVAHCRQNPPSDWPEKAYTLIGRQDLSKLMSTKSDSQTTQKSRATKTRSKEVDDGMSDMELGEQALKMRFASDLRVDDVMRFLQSSKPVRISLTQRPEVSDHDFVEEQEYFLLATSVRTMALPVGRSAWVGVILNDDPKPEFVFASECSTKATFGKIPHLPKYRNFSCVFVSGHIFNVGACTESKFIACEVVSAETECAVEATPNTAVASSISSQHHDRFTRNGYAWSPPGGCGAVCQTFTQFDNMDKVLRECWAWEELIDVKTRPTPLPARPRKKKRFQNRKEREISNELVPKPKLNCWIYLTSDPWTMDNIDKESVSGTTYGKKNCFTMIYVEHRQTNVPWSNLSCDAVTRSLPVKKKCPCPTPTPKPATTTQPQIVTKPTVATTKPPLVTSKQPLDSTKSPVVSTKSPLVSTKSPVVSTKQPFVSTKLPLDSTKSPLVTTKPPLTSTKPPITTQSAPVTETTCPVCPTSSPCQCLTTTTAIQPTECPPCIHQTPCPETLKNCSECPNYKAICDACPTPTKATCPPISVNCSLCTSEQTTLAETTAAPTTKTLISPSTKKTHCSSCPTVPLDCTKCKQNCSLCPFNQTACSVACSTEATTPKILTTPKIPTPTNLTVHQTSTPESTGITETPTTPENPTTFETPRIPENSTTPEKAETPSSIPTPPNNRTNSLTTDQSTDQTTITTPHTTISTTTADPPKPTDKTTHKIYSQLTRAIVEHLCNYYKNCLTDPKKKAAWINSVCINDVMNNSTIVNHIYQTVVAKFNLTKCTLSPPERTKCSCEQTTYNLTSVEQKETFISSILANMSIDVKNTSSNTRRYTSAKDDRPSARNLGCVGVALIGLFLIGLAILDLNRFVTFVKECFSKD